LGLRKALKGSKKREKGPTRQSKRRDDEEKWQRGRTQVRYLKGGRERGIMKGSAVGAWLDRPGKSKPRGAVK